MRRDDIERQLRPSASSRWSKCTASAGFINNLIEGGVLSAPDPDDDGGPFAAEGTLAHKHAESALWRYRELGIQGVKDYFAYTEMPAEMAEHVQGYVDLCIKHSKDADVVCIEESLKVMYGVNESFGTMDFGACKKDGSKVFINDLKYGAGVSVQAKDNTQLLIYARAFAEILEEDGAKVDKDTLVCMNVYQPRIKGEPALRSWVISYEELMELHKTIEDSADVSIREAGKFSPSEDTCRFCPAASCCSALADRLLGELPREPKEIHELHPNQLSTEEQFITLSLKKDIVKWLNSLETFMEDQMVTKGLSHPDWKVVRKNTHRKWLDEESADKVLRKVMPVAKYTVKKLLSPTQVLDLLKKNNARKTTIENINGLVTVPEGQLTIAPIADKREAVVQVDEEFDDVEEEENLEGEDLL